MLPTSISDLQSTKFLDETLDRISVLKKNAGKCQFMRKLWSFSGLYSKSLFLINLEITCS